ncbi:MAG: twin-arginine translocation signal domain-containing protein [Deltaproteobacteria bacterium]
MKSTRRKFLQFTGAAAGASLLLGPEKTFASTVSTPPSNQFAMLNDTTRCIGCQACERACSEKNGLPAPVEEPRSGFRRTTSTEALSLRLPG